MGEAGLIAARAASYIAMMLAAGIPLYLIAAGRIADITGRAMRLSGFAAVAAMAASIWWALASIAAMAALPIWQLDTAMTLAVLDATPLGDVLAVRMIALLAAIGAAWRRNIIVAALAGSLALASIAWTGHAGASEAGLGALHRASDVIHLLAAATWLSALLLFLTAAISGRDPQGLVRHLSGFAATGSVVVILLLVTGVVNTVMIAGLPLDWSKQWSLLLVAKVALFLAMLVLAARNRWLLTPALARSADGSHRALLLSLTLETVAALAIILIVGVLGTLSPE